MYGANYANFVVCKRHCATDLNKKVLTRYKNAIKFKKKKLFIILQITRDLIKVKKKNCFLCPFYIFLTRK